MPSTELKLEIEQALNNVTEKTLQPQSLADVVRKILEEDSRLVRASGEVITLKNVRHYRYPGV